MTMITADWVRMMARYNKWQNDSMTAAMRTLDDAALREDRGAFFGSILGTANHLLWGDTIWMSRLDGGPKPSLGIKESPGLTQTFPAWTAERFRLDGRITIWARALSNVDLAGTLTWYSGTAGEEKTMPMALIVTHFFNHQTHHRGQIHAMLTAAGARTGDTDLFLMPEMRDS